jgi:hypothetical protein
VGDDRAPAGVSAPPVFVLAPPRSGSTVAVAMLGRHPQLYGFPELGLFRTDTIAARPAAPGLIRALAQLHDGEQTPHTTAAAQAWLHERRDWPGAKVYDHLRAACAPQIAVEKSPEHTWSDAPLRRIAAACPDARYVHLVRHPFTTVASMHRQWRDRGHWAIEPRLLHHFCLGVWLHQHARIERFLAPPEANRRIVVRAEDLVTRPDPALRRICVFLGIDDAPGARAAMSHPERWPYASLGPPGARGGGDAGFLRSPTLRPVLQVPAATAAPPGWQVDPWLLAAALALAARLGYDDERAAATVAPTRPIAASSGARYRAAAPSARSCESPSCDDPATSTSAVSASRARAAISPTALPSSVCSSRRPSPVMTASHTASRPSNPTASSTNGAPARSWAP